MHLWKADYNRDEALAGLRKRDQVIGLLNDFDLDNHPERFEWIPKEPFDCLFCPWWRAEPTSGLQCRGDE
jgi:hypothetical protein